MVNSFVINVTGVITLFKFITGLTLNAKMKNLLGRIKSDWEIWSTEEEVKLLEKYAEEGRKFSVMYTVAITYYVISYLSFTISPVILDLITPLPNGTRPKNYALPEDFGRYQEKYYYYIFVHNSSGIIINFILAIGMDTIYFVCVQHICGVFAAIGHRLENIVEKSTELYRSNASKNIILDEIFFCIRQHVSAIQYAEAVESTYGMYFLFLIGINVILLTFTGFQVLIQLGNVDSARFTNYTLLLVGQLYFYSVPGQRLMDHSLIISQRAYNCTWYKMPTPIRKTILMVMMRSSKPCQITTGKISVISMQSFSTVLRTAASYFTVLMSMR